MLEKRIDAAAGRCKADLVLKNGRYVNVFTGTVERGDIAVADGAVVGVGDYAGEAEIDLGGKIAVPGLIDAHVHVESSQLSPGHFAQLVVPHGTTTIVADPHEIANVCGVEGVAYLADAIAKTPLEAKMMLPSCVPATAFETNGAALTGADTERYIGDARFWGLGEFMNYPGVFYKDEEALRKLKAAHAAGKIVDGHAPAAAGKGLNAYVAAGISTDHESASPEEAAEKVAKGMYVHLREGSAAHNVAANCRAVTAANLRRFLFCTDDRHAADLRDEGHIDNALRVAVGAGLDPVWAVTAATLNAAECYGLRGKGAIAPGYDADIAVFDDLQSFRCAMTFKKGELVAENGRALFGAENTLPACVRGTVHVGKVAPEQFRLALRGERARVIGVEAGSLVTKNLVRTVKSRDGDVLLQGTDLLKLAVVERHRGTGNIGLGLLEGYGLKGGAIGLTIAHDSHNIVIAGDRNEDMAAVAEELRRIGGGMAISGGGRVDSIPLDIAGLMSSLPPDEYIAQLAALTKRADAMGVARGVDAFMSLSFLALPVIPSLKLTDRGLFDVDAFAFTSVDA